MKKKQLYTLIVVVVILAILYAYQKKSREKNWDDGNKSASEKLLPANFDTEKIAAVRITKDGKSLTMEKKDAGWGLKERFGYPIDFASLKSMFFDLYETGVAQTLDLVPTQVEAMALNEKSGAVKLELLDAKGEVLQKLFFGKKHSNKKSDAENVPNPYGFNMGGSVEVGRYLLLNDGRYVIAAETFDKVDQDATKWLNQDFFSISNVKKASLTKKGKALWNVARGKSSDDLKLVGAAVPANKEVDTSKLNSVKNAFNYFQFADIAGTSKEAPLKNASVLTVEDFDGFKYVIDYDPAEKGENKLQVSVSWKGKKNRDAAKDEKPEDKAAKDQAFAKKIKENKDKVIELNARLRGWTYLVDSAKLSSIPSDLAEFLKDKPKPKESAKKDATEKKNASVIK